MNDSIAVRDLDEGVMRGLRARAAEHGRSVEEEALEILRQTLGEADAPATPAAPPENLATAIRARVADIGGVELELPPRGPAREPPNFD